MESRVQPKFIRSPTPAYSAPSLMAMNTSSSSMGKVLSQMVLPEITRVTLG